MATPVPTPPPTMATAGAEGKNFGAQVSIAIFSALALANAAVYALAAMMPLIAVVPILPVVILSIMAIFAQWWYGFGALAIIAFSSVALGIAVGFGEDKLGYDYYMTGLVIGSLGLTVGLIYLVKMMVVRHESQYNHFHMHPGHTSVKHHKMHRKAPNHKPLHMVRNRHGKLVLE